MYDRFKGENLRTLAPKFGGAISAKDVAKVQADLAALPEATTSRWPGCFAGGRLDRRPGSRTISSMIRTIVLWALVLAAGAFGLQWLEYQYLARVFSVEIYISLVGVAFAVGGVWAGWKLASRSAPGPFDRNTAALASLGLTSQEVRVLERLAAGQSNKEIARTLGLSPNTVKTHVAHLFEKLDVNRRTQAIGKARELHLIP